MNIKIVSSTATVSGRLEVVIDILDAEARELGARLLLGALAAPGDIALLADLLEYKHAEKDFMTAVVSRAW